jgi:hypothetical protein
LATRKQINHLLHPIIYGSCRSYKLTVEASGGGKGGLKVSGNAAMAVVVVLLSKK